jgi:hypothetical protein
MSPFNRVEVPNKFWATIMVKDHDGKLHGRVAHAMVEALTPLQAADLDLVHEIEERALSHLPPGKWTIETTIRPVCTEGATNG